MSLDLTQYYRKFTEKLGYTFRDSGLLQTALTHSSHNRNHNERLEFLGDAVLGWVIAEALYQQFPHAREGQLSRLRSGLVKGDTLAELARELDLGQFIRLGQGEMKSGGQRRKSTLADALEAVMGAIVLDSGVDECRTVVLGLYEDRLLGLSLDDNLKDPKTRLQEFLQARRQPLPDYEIVSTRGKDHDQTFQVLCRVESLPDPVQATGRSRRHAEQAAAALALKALGVK